MRRTKIKGAFNKPKRNPKEESYFSNMSPVGLLRVNRKRMPSTLLIGDIEFIAVVWDVNSLDGGCSRNHH